MDIPHPAQHCSLVCREPSIPEAPRMDPQLLLIEIPHLQHGKLGKEGVGMVPTPLSSNQPCKPLLIPKKGLLQGDILL